GAELLDRDFRVDDLLRAHDRHLVRDAANQERRGPQRPRVLGHAEDPRRRSAVVEAPGVPRGRRARAHGRAQHHLLLSRMTSSWAQKLAVYYSGLLRKPYGGSPWDSISAFRSASCSRASVRSSPCTARSRATDRSRKVTTSI